jgi:diguanylate cyclase (GGDEF)-like protein
MSRHAWGYVLAIIGLGALLSVLSLRNVQVAPTQWLAFAVLVTFCTLSHLFKARGPSHEAWHLNLVFLFAGVLLLPPALYVLLVFVPHTLEWAKERLMRSASLRKWYIQPFNMGTHIIVGSVASWVLGWLGTQLDMTSAFSRLFSVALALSVYVTLNHLFVATVLVVARGVTWRESGLLDVENVVGDSVLLCLGYVMATLWEVSPWLVLPALAPLLLIYRALAIPQLKKEAQTDAKTGLLNAGQFAKLYEVELERARRFGRPLSLIMSDLDLLRNINNTYGHLAGDAVLAQIGKIMRENTRTYDIAARFGGEEFVVVLPEVEGEQARAFAERLRRIVEETDVPISTNPTPIRITLSLGVATFPHDADNGTSLIHEADVAVYQAKLTGRNRVVLATEVPHSIKLDVSAARERLASPYMPQFVPRPETVGGSVRAEPETPAVAPASPVPAPPVDAVTSDASRVVPPGEAQAPSPVAPPPKGRQPASVLWLVVSVVALGALATLWGLGVSPRPTLAALALFTLLAVAGELLQVDVYGESTVSVSVAVLFAAAAVLGILGVLAAGAAITLIHALRRKAALHKSLFNWSVHILAGAVPTFVFQVAYPVSLQINSFPVLLVMAAIAGLAYFGVESGLISAAVAISQDEGLVTTWRAHYRWLQNYYVVLCIMGLFLALAYQAMGLLGVIVFALPVLMMRYSQQQYVKQTAQSVEELRRMNAELGVANREVTEASLALRQLNEELFLTLAKIIDARDPYITGHATKVAEYATGIARAMHLPAEQVERVRQGAYLHDIGKIGIAEHILKKPAHLTDTEYTSVKTHSALGGDFLETCRGLRHLAAYVRHHHERWDGAGYPQGLHGEEIPIEARILAVCDAADAMLSDRPYRPAMTTQAAITELQRCAGTQFDAQVVAVLVGLLDGQAAGAQDGHAPQAIARPAPAEPRSPGVATRA